MSMSSNRPLASPQPEAGPSRPSSAQKAQRPDSRESWFAYPTPPAELVDAELPPYLESENVPMGLILDNLARRSHDGLQTLLSETLPKLESRQKPREVIAYAKSTRQAVLKYLAVLRWKTAVDVATTEPADSTASNGQPSFPTPHSMGDSFSPGTNTTNVKGKGKMTGAEEESKLVIRGKVTDAKRITEYLLYQNSQHDMAVDHLRHAAKQVEGLRVRNPDLLTAVSLLTRGTYTRLPSAITESFVPRPRLTNADIVNTLRRLDAHILYRLRCVDYVPPDIRIDRIKDGRAYITGGKGDWRAELSMTGFGTGDQSRWWMTGLEWDWKGRLKDGKDKSGKAGKRFKGNERQEILDTVNRVVLPAPEGSSAEASKGVGVHGSSTPLPGQETKRSAKLDAPLVRLVNFIQHLSLSYQLELLFTQAMTLSRESWRNQLRVEIDRSKKSLSLKYWIRPRSTAPLPPAPGQPRRPGQQPPLGAPRPPAVGATITVSLVELDGPMDEEESLRRAIAACEDDVSERVLRLGLKVRWEIGEAGAGGGWKTGEVMDTSSLQLSPRSLDIEDIIKPATRAHAAHLTRHHTLQLMALTTPLITCTYQETDARPLALHVALPSRQRRNDLIVWVPPHTGLLEIEDESAKSSSGLGGDERANRTRLATNGVNSGVAKLPDALKRLIIAIFTDNLETQMRQLGWSPARKLPIKLNELAKNDLTPASTIFVQLPTSNLHHLVTKVSPASIEFELLRLARVPAENGVGMKLAIRDRSPLDLQRLRQRALDVKNKRKREDAALELPIISEPQEVGFDVSNRDLRDLYIFSNALVARMLVEQQLKDRAIPYAEQYPRATGPDFSLASSALAGLIPNIVVNAKDLLNDGRAAEVAMPKVHLQIKDWWKGGQCQVVTIVQLRHRASSPTTAASPGLNNASTSSAARAEGISFDQSSSIVRFTAKEISRCVPAFLEQWERLSKVIMVAGDVNRLNKLAVFKDLRMLSFDLRTATFSYSPGFNASITYSSNSDSYECSFFRSSAVNTPATPMTATGDSNPHELLAPLLSHRLNELTRRSDAKKGTVGKGFISLLRNTLPILLEIDGIRVASTTEYPKLVVVAVDEYRLVWDVEGSKRYAMDLALLQDDRYLITDASAPLPDGLVDLSCGPLLPIPSFSTHVAKIYDSLRTSYRNDKAQGVLATKLDKGKSMAVLVGVAGEVVRGLCAEVELAISGNKTKAV